MILIIAIFCLCANRFRQLETENWLPLQQDCLGNLLLKNSLKTMLTDYVGYLRAVCKRNVYPQVNPAHSLNGEAWIIHAVISRGPPRRRPYQPRPPAPSRGKIFSVCGHLCGQGQNTKNQGRKKVTQNRKIRQKPTASSGFVVDDTGLEPVTSRTSSIFAKPLYILVLNGFLSIPTQNCPEVCPENAVDTASIRLSGLLFIT